MPSRIIENDLSYKFAFDTVNNIAIQSIYKE